MRVLLFLIFFPAISDCCAQKQLTDSLEIYQEVKHQLLTIYKNDQQGRQVLDSISHKYGAKSNQVDSLWKAIQATDQVNLEKIKMILSQYGWIGEDRVGVQASMAQFLVIQCLSPLNNWTKLQKQFSPFTFRNHEQNKAEFYSRRSLFYRPGSHP